MQKILLAALLGGASLGARAQTSIPKGTVQLGGAVNYSYQSGGNSGGNNLDTSSRSFYVSPAAGYFVADNLAVGLSTGFSSTYTRSNSAGYYNYSFTEQKNNSFNIGPFAQYYRMLTDKFGLAGTASVLYTRSRYEYSGIDTANGSYGSVSEGNGLYASLVPSLVFFPIPKFALGASIGNLSYGYSRSRQLDNPVTSDAHSNTFGANFGLSYLSLSGTYYFGR